MPDLRINQIDSELLFDLKVMALDKDTTLRQLVIDLLSSASTRHMRSRTIHSAPPLRAKSTRLAGGKK